MHDKRTKRNGSLENKRAATAEEARERLMRAALDYAEADPSSDAAWNGAYGKLEHAALEVARMLKPGREKDLESRRKWRAERAANIRIEVMRRCKDRCEFCGVSNRQLEWHHVISGTERRRLESVETTAALCLPCHRGWHRNDLAVLRNAKEWAIRGRYRAALQAIERRMTKITEARNRCLIPLCDGPMPRNDG